MKDTLLAALRVVSGWSGSIPRQIRKHANMLSNATVSLAMMLTLSIRSTPWPFIQSMVHSLQEVEMALLQSGMPLPNGEYEYIRNTILVLRRCPSVLTANI